MLAIVALAMAVWLYQPLKDGATAAELSASANRYQVEIVRDQWGVPHIRGERDVDVGFGLAYAHAEDDYETIQEVTAATRGVLASYKGRAAAPTDYIVALLDVWGVLERRYQNDVPQGVKDYAAAYAAGLNLFAAEHPEQTWSGLAPFKAEDVIAGFVFKTPFFYGLDGELLKLFDESRRPNLVLDPAESETAFQVRDGRPTQMGSNAIAVNKERSGDDHTRLLINSHQPMTGPVAWYEAHLSSRESLEITGGLFPGTPLILHGFNQNIAWANTVNHIDLSDVYVLERNPSNPRQYKLDDQWLDFVVEEVEISVKLFGPFRYPAKRQVLRSEHGPVIDGKHGTYALRFAGMGEIRQFEQYLRLNRAKNFNEFLAAMAMNALPSINYIYADKDDNIAFVHNAQYPRRVAGWDWKKDLPGNRSDLIWPGYLEFNQVPKLVNPASGLIFNANNTPFSATDGPDNLRAQDFPVWMGLATNQTNRALRLIELNDGESKVGEAELLALKFDHYYSKQSDQYALAKKLMALNIKNYPELEDEIKHVNAWDRGTDQQNQHTALVILTLRKILTGPEPEDHSPEALAAALSSSSAFLRERFHSIAVEWGAVNRLIRGSVNLPLDGGPDVLRAIYSNGLPPEVLPHATHGDTWMALVEWDKEGRQTAKLLHQFGSATLDKNSPHYNDQAPLFARKQWRNALLDWSDIEQHARQRTLLGNNSEVSAR